MDYQEYTARLKEKQNASWKEIIRAVDPYRWNIKRLNPGYTLEIGCGIGRILKYLNGYAVGIDINPFSIEVCRQRGLLAFSPAEFIDYFQMNSTRFDTLLLSHVLEHMTEAQAIDCLLTYLPYLKSEAKIILITPQEKGYASDPTHVQFMDFATLRSILKSIGYQAIREFSFPFPRRLGNIYIYNEFVVVGSKIS